MGSRYLLFAGITENGQELDQDQCRRLFDLPGEILTTKHTKDTKAGNVDEASCLVADGQGNLINREGTQGTQNEISVHSCEFVVQKLKKQVLVEISERNAVFFDEEMEKRRSKLRRNLFDEQDQIDQRKDDLLETIEAKMSQETTEEKVMRISWEIK